MTVPNFDVQQLTETMHKLAKAMVLESTGCRPIGLLFSKSPDTVRLVTLNLDTDETRKESLEKFRGMLRAHKAYAGVVMFESYYNLEKPLTDSRYVHSDLEHVVTLGGSAFETFLVEESFVRTEEGVQFTGNVDREPAVRTAIFDDVWPVHYA